MSKAQHKGKFLVGLFDENGRQHRSFSLHLLTVKDEIAMHEKLAMDHPNLDQYDDFKRFTIERAARLSFMIDSIGELTGITIDRLLDLTSEDFEILIAAELELLKKLKEPTEQGSPEAQ